MAWYDRLDYPGILDVMEDARKLPETYDAWLMSAEQVEGVVRTSGVTVVRVRIRPEVFGDWCAARGLKRDGAARTRFAQEGAETDDLQPDQAPE